MHHFFPARINVLLFCSYVAAYICYDMRRLRLFSTPKLKARDSYLGVFLAILSAGCILVRACTYIRMAT